MSGSDFPDDFLSKHKIVIPETDWKEDFRSRGILYFCVGVFTKLFNCYFFRFSNSLHSLDLLFVV